MSDNIKTIIATMRLPFVLLTPACLLLGYAFVLFDGYSVDYLDFSLVLIAGLAAHISANVYNEYFDFKSGLDFTTQVTPFSGGSGSLPANPDAAPQALLLANSTLIITALIGLYFIYLHGWTIAPLGILGLIIIVTYTTYITQHPILCLIAAGLGFGPLMINGAYFALTGQYSMAVALVSLIPFFLVNNLLLLNQYPDIKADQENGRYHILIAWGVNTSNKIFYLLYGLTYLTLILLVLFNIVPMMGLIGLITIIIAFKVILEIHKYSDDSLKLLPAMGMNVAVNILTPVLIGLGIIWAV